MLSVYADPTQSCGDTPKRLSFFIITPFNRDNPSYPQSCARSLDNNEDIWYDHNNGM